MRVPRARTSVIAVEAAALAIGIIFVAAGCTPEPDPTPTSQPTVTAGPAPFETEEEALALAEATLAGYVEVNNAVGQGGWADPSLYESVAEGDFLEQLVAEANDFNSEGLRQVGSAVHENVSLQDWRPQRGLIVAYVCLDVSATDVVRPNGESVVSPERVPRSSKVITIMFRDDEGLITEEEQWTGTDICA